MSTRSRRSRGRPPRTPLSNNRTNLLRKPKAYQHLDSNISSSGSRTSSPVSHLIKPTRSERIRGRAASSRGRHFLSQLIADDEDDVASLPDFVDRHSNSDNSDLDENGSDSVSLIGEIDPDQGESDNESLSTVSSSVSRKKLLIKRPKTPEIIDDEKKVPPLELPESASDLLLPKEHVLQAIGIYEVLRHFRTILRLSPFTFENFCACLLVDEQSYLLSEIHITLMKALLREEDSANSTFGPQDLKDSINVSFYYLDSMTWPEVVRAYLDSEKHPEYRAHLSILETPDFPFVPYVEKLQVLQTLTDLFVAITKVREEIINEGAIHYDDHCRACHKLGDLLCCETCSAVYHLTCVDPPMHQVPEHDWFCSVCKAHQVKGVTDCVSEAEKSGLLCRQEPIGYDRHMRKYWFLCRRIIVESETDVRYYSSKYQLEELLDNLDPEYESDLITYINEMKDDILKQMTFTEDLTNAVKGSRKTMLEIENDELIKIQAERALKKAQEEEDRKAKEEEERIKKEEEEEKEFDTDEDKIDNSGDKEMSKTNDDKDVENCEDMETDVTCQTEGTTQTSTPSSSGDSLVTEMIQTTTMTTTVTTVKSMSTSTTITRISTDEGDDNGEPPTKLAKLEDSIGGKAASDVDKVVDDQKIILNAKSALAEAIKASSDGKPKVINLQSLLPAARQSLLNVVGKSGDESKNDGNTKAVLLVNRDGGKLTLQVQNQPLSKEESNTATTSMTTTLEGKKLMTTRSKTGSLTPKIYTDSVTITTNSSKVSSKNTEEVLLMNKDGEITRVSTRRSVTSSLATQSIYFKLGAESSFKQFNNQYTTNTLALNKHQHNEERDKRRHLSHKFSLTNTCDFKWNGNTLGNKMNTLTTLRSTITSLEGLIQAPFLHINWPNQRANWQKAVQMCLTPKDFGLALSILEACIKPCAFNPVWRESLGHLRLNRITIADREEWKKKEKDQKKNKDDDDSGLKPVVWIKYTLGLKHQVWKQKGEEYRVTGGNGWVWRSAVRNYREVPQDSIGLRLSARRLKNRKLKSSKLSLVDPNSSDTEDGLSEDDNVDLDPITGETVKKWDVDAGEKMRNPDDSGDRIKQLDSQGDLSDLKVDGSGDAKVKDSEDGANLKSLCEVGKPDASETETSMDVDIDVAQCTVESTSNTDSQNIPNGCIEDTENTTTENEENVISNQGSNIKSETENADIKQEVNNDTDKQVKKEMSKIKDVCDDVKPVSLRDLRRQTATENFLSYMKTKYVENENTALVLNLLKKHPAKADVDLINVCDSMVKRTYYPKVTKPYSKLDLLLDRRLKQEEVEKRQRLAIETQIAIKTKVSKVVEQKEKDEVLKDSDIKDETILKKGLLSGPKWLHSCYSLACRNGDKGFYSSCYSPLCQSSKTSLRKTLAISKPQAIADIETDSASSSNRSSKEGTPTESVTLQELKAKLPANLDDEIMSESQESPVGSKELSPAVSKEGTPLESVMKEGTPAFEQSKSSNSSFQNSFIESLKSKGLDSSLSKDEKNKPVSRTGTETGDNDIGIGTEEEDVDIEGGLDLKLESFSDPSGGKSSASKTSENTKDSNPKTASVSDIVKKRVIKNMSERAQLGKVPTVSAEALAFSLEELEAKLPPKRSTSDKTKLPKFARFNSKKSKLSRDGKLPECHKFQTNSEKKKSVLVLERHELKKIARQGAKRESSMYNYNCKMNNVCWPYPCPRPSFKTAWRYRTISLQSLSAAALQLRILWGCIRWDDMAAKPPAGGTNTISTESEITTTELLKRREVGIDGLRSEFLVRKIVVPLGVPEKPKEKYTPQRSGLRERKVKLSMERPTEPSVTEVWIPEEVLDLWEIKQFGDKLEKQRLAAVQAEKEKEKAAAAAEKAAAAAAASAASKTVGSQQSSAQIKAQMEQQLKQQRLALAQKRIAENQGIRISSGATTVTLNGTSTLTNSTGSGTTIIINNSQQIGKPGATFKTLTVPSSSSLLNSGVIKTMPKTINIASSNQIRPGIRVQIPGTQVQLRPQGVTLAPKPGTAAIASTTATASGGTRMVTQSPSTTQPQVAKTIQIKPQSGSQPVQNLHFIQTPNGQLQVRGLHPGQIIQRMADGKLQIITLSSQASAVTASQSVATAQAGVTSQTSSPRPALGVRPQTILVSMPGSSGVSSTPTIATQSRLVMPAQLGQSPSTGVRQALASSVAAGTPHKQIIINRPGGPQVISAANLATVLGNQPQTPGPPASASPLVSSSVGMSSAVVINAPSPSASTVLVNAAGQQSTLVSSLTSSTGSSQQSVISTLSPLAGTTPAASSASQTSLLGTSLLQRPGGSTSLLSLNNSASSGTLTLATGGQVTKLLGSPSSGTQIITRPGASSQPQLLLRPGTSVITGAGGQKVITAQQLQGLTHPSVQLKAAAGSSMSPIKSILSPQQSTLLPAMGVGKTAVRPVAPQHITGQQQVLTDCKVVGSSAAGATSLLTHTLTTSSEAGSGAPGDAASMASPPAGASPAAGAAKYAITPQVVEQVVRQALLQNQTPEIQQKLLAMQKQIQSQQQGNPSTVNTSTLSMSSGLTSCKRGAMASSVTTAISRTALTTVTPPATTEQQPRASKSSKGLTQEQKEEQSRVSVCGQVMKSILDRIEREEKAEQRNKKKQESADEKQKRIAALNQQKALYRHKEALKKEIHRKRSLMEKNLQQEIYIEMAEMLKQAKATINNQKSPPAGVLAAQAAPVQASPAVAKPVPMSIPASKIIKKVVVENPKGTIKAQPVVVETKAANRKRKQKIISTGPGFKGLNPKEKLYCVCKTPYDESKFYIGCDLCSNWFHGACVGINENEANYIDSYICEDCRKQQENTSEELYCLCRTPYNENQFYIGCDRCQDWFHGHCVGISKAEADNIDMYVCPNCQKEEVTDPIAQKPLTQSEYQHLNKLLKELQSHKMSWPFLNPVDPREVPDYYNIVSEPMDLTIVEAKLNAKAYHKLNDFLKDVTRIFDNCRLYNPVETAYFQCAEVVETYFAQKVKALRSANKL